MEDKIQLFDGKKNITRISIICMFKNNASYLENFLFDKIIDLEKTYDVHFDFYVIENNSQDNTRDLLKSFFKLQSKQSKLLLFNLKTDFKNVGDGRNYERLYNLANIRNKLINTITPLRSDWCLFIDSNIHFETNILSKMFAYNPLANNIGMMIPYTQQLFIPQIHKLPNLDKPTLLSHFYDTFSFYDEHSKTYWPHCPFKKCKICTRNNCMQRKPIPEDQSIVDVNSGFSGFCLIDTDIINDKRIRWDTLSYEVSKDESVCEHFLFCFLLKKLTDKRIVVLQDVDRIYRTI